MVNFTFFFENDKFEKLLTQIGHSVKGTIHKLLFASNTPNQMNTEI